MATHSSISVPHANPKLLDSHVLSKSTHLCRHLRRTHGFLMKHSIASLVDWSNMTIGGVHVTKASTFDFRCEPGRTFRQHFLHVEAKILKQAITKMKIISYLLNQTPELQTNFVDWYKSATDVTQLAVTNTPTTPGLVDLPEKLRIRLHALVMGWWTRYTIQAKGIGYYLPHTWSNDVDPVTMDNVNTELPSIYKFMYMCPTPRNSKPRVFVFDVRSLYVLFREKHFTNPFDNVEKFDKPAIHRVNVRYTHLKSRGIPLLDCTNPPSKRVKRQTIKERVVLICAEMDRLDYSTNVEWLLDLNLNQIVRWYQRCEDIWNYRAQLTSDQRRAIAPGLGSVFPSRNRIRRTRCHSEAMHIMLDAMEKLITTGITEADRVLGVLYTLSALTECSETFREAYSYLYQPPDVANPVPTSTSSEHTSADIHPNLSPEIVQTLQSFSGPIGPAALAWLTASDTILEDVSQTNTPDTTEPGLQTQTNSVTPNLPTQT